MKYLLATNAYSNPDLLEKCITSWPKGINNLDTAVFLDGFYYQKIFKDLFDKKILEQNVNHVIKPDVPTHLGCSGGWNVLIRHCFDKLNYDYIIVVGSDTCFKPGFVEAFIRDLETIKPDFAVGQDTMFNCWTMNRNCYEKIGLWDENFFPAYFEDGDYHCRIKLSDIVMKNVGDSGLFEHFGSATIKTNNERNNTNHLTFVKNEAYFKKKWLISGNWDADYKTPFNNPNMKINEWYPDEPEWSIKRKIWKDLEDRLNR